ncbi:MAG: hypothetical protein AAGK21_04340 [Bacteroidota bacterium]
MPISPSDAIHVVLRQAGPLDRLASCACRRHGLGNTDIMSGLLYPTDLDAYEIEVEGHYIAPGHVELYAEHGPDGLFEVQVRESDYLSALATALAESGDLGRAAEVESVRKEVRSR